MYNNGFAERFEIALDEDECTQLINELEEQLKQGNSKLETAQELTKSAEQAALDIEKLLTKKRNKIALQDVLRREGQKDVSNSLNLEIEEINQRIGRLGTSAESLQSQVKELDDRKRAKEIKNYYLKEMQGLLESLNVVNILEASYKSLHCTIKESGSDLPRAILAYYLALNSTISEYGTSTICPMVVDSPRQQDQDNENWEKMLHYLRDNQQASQFILATVDDCDVDFGGTVIELKKQNQVLQRKGYKSAMVEIRPLIKASLAPDA